MKVLVTRDIPRDGITLLKNNGIDVVVHQSSTPLPRQQLLSLVHDIDGLICLLDDKIDQELIDAAPSLKVISNYAVGYDNIDVKYAEQKGIWVTNTPDVLTNATADLTWALILAITRRIIEGKALIDQHQFHGWGPKLLLGLELAGSTLGIIGAGRIGTAVAKRGFAFEMNVLYYSRSPNSELDQLGARFVSLDELLSTSDIVSLHVPLTPETFNLLSAEKIQLMKQGSYLINTARGAVVDEEALIAALKSGHLAGAALDVFQNEPHLRSEFYSLSNVLVTPHIGSATHRTRSQMSLIAAKNVLAVLSGGSPPTPVNHPS